ncbi:MBL fold metallo-hydrolase [Candidatus Sumerlaeota bacterium]|nr:MBL fold metallo-hydrolase [Candidatus Sumerlaeota bacterium]
MKIIILVDNHAGEGLVAEHGLSLWIEIGDQCILFDTGQGSALEHNARALGVDLSRTDLLVLSHGHFDHTGAIPHVLQQAPNADVYCHPGIGVRRYSIRDEIAEPIQIPPACLDAINQLPAQRLHWIQEPLPPSDSLGITGPVPRETAYEDTGGPFFLDPAGKNADPIEDDLALWIHTDDGVVVCAGCSHAGLINTLNYIRRLSGVSKFRAVIGGFHLVNASDQRLQQSIEALQQLELEMIVPCHCTGDAAVTALREALGERAIQGASGMIFDF